MIFTARQCNQHTFDILRRWLSDHIPDWEGFQICDHAKYLGIFLGPSLGGINFVAPMDKFVARTQDIAVKKQPLDLACGSFAAKALSVVGYVGQVVTPP